MFPELIYRGAKQLGFENWGDLTKMRYFGGEVSEYLRKHSPEGLLITWSSFGLESMRLEGFFHRAVMRDSCHIDYQLELLEEEYSAFHLQMPDRTRCRERELEEYARADTLFVLSELAKRSFLVRGVDTKKLVKLPLGVDTSLFTPKPIRTPKLPLKVVYFGGLSVRKGIRYLLEAIGSFSTSELQVTLIGNADATTAHLLSNHPEVRLLKAMPQSKLVPILHEQDIFVMPTIEDGFGQTLIQAMSCGLVPIVSDHCGASEVISNVSGRVFPSRDSTTLRNYFEEFLDRPESLLALSEKAKCIAQERSWNLYETSLQAWIQHLECEVKPSTVN